MSVMKAIVPLWIACWVLAPLLFGWAIWRWWRSKPRFELPLWRSRLALAAFGLGGLSLLLSYFVVIRGQVAIARGSRYYDLLPFDGLGSLLGLAGAVTSLAAKGNLRWPAFFISAAMVLIWYFTG
jgi:hypothetical protein